MKPVYSNGFNIGHNKVKSEVTLTFSHGYTDHNYSMQNGALTDVSAQVVEEVASIVMSREGAVAVAKIMNKLMKDWGIDIDQF